MIDSSTARQVLALAGQGLAAKDIALGLNIEQGLVDVVLARNGAAPVDRDIGDEQLAVLRIRAFEIAVQNEDLSESAKMVRWLIERDKPKLAAGNVSPIIAINNAITLAQEKVRELVAEYETPNEDSSSIKLPPDH